MRFDRAAPEELRPIAPFPRVAPNGVEWLPVPEWEKLRWLWHGFSTRRGGLSRAYCAEDAPGELNLGFTASRRPGNRDPQSSAAGRGNHRRRGHTSRDPPPDSFQPGSSCRRCEMPAGDRRQESRRPDDRSARPAARHSDRRLHPGAGGRPQAPRGGRLPRRLAGNGQAHRRERRWPHEARVRLPA